MSTEFALHPIGTICLILLDLVALNNFDKREALSVQHNNGNQ
jgi:hypothetical protein